jgi:hypothetical protein
LLYYHYCAIAATAAFLLLLKLEAEIMGRELRKRRIPVWSSVFFSPVMHGRFRVSLCLTYLYLFTPVFLSI